MPASDTFYPSNEAGAWSNLLRRVKMLNVLAFVVPATQFMEIKAIGRLFLPDVLLACMLPMLFLAHGKRLRARLPMIFILLAISWFIGQVATDIIRGSVFDDYVRGWAKIGFTLVNFCALYLLLHGHPRRLILYAAGLAVGGLISYFLNPNLYAADYPWKFGYGASITWVLILLAVAVINRNRMGPYIASGILVAAAALNLFMDFRSLGGICFLTASYLFVQARWREQLSNIRAHPRQVLLIGLVIAVAGLGVFEMYKYAARTGLLGEDAHEKYMSQASGEYGLFLGGRSEILVSGRAILESPFLGYGSWAKDREYSSLLVELRRQAGYMAGTEEEEDLIPTHSYLLGAWVEAGLLGAIFWAWVIILTIRGLFRPQSMMEGPTPLIAFIAFLLIWDILFSPYGSMGRFVAPYYVVAMMTCLEAYRGLFTIKVTR